MLTARDTPTFTLKPLAAPLGAEVTGIDLSRPVDAATRKALHDAWVKHAVLVIRGQKLTPAQFADAAAIFGELLEQQVKKYALDGQPAGRHDLQPRSAAGRRQAARARGELPHRPFELRRAAQGDDAARRVAAVDGRRHAVRRRAQGLRRAAGGDQAEDPAAALAARLREQPKPAQDDGAQPRGAREDPADAAAARDPPPGERALGALPQHRPHGGHRGHGARRGRSS